MMNSIESIYVRAIKTRCTSNEQTFDVFNEEKCKEKKPYEYKLEKNQDHTRK